MRLRGRERGDPEDAERRDFDWLLSERDWRLLPEDVLGLSMRGKGNSVLQ